MLRVGDLLARSDTTIRAVVNCDMGLSPNFKFLNSVDEEGAVRREADSMMIRLELEFGLELMLCTESESSTACCGFMESV